MAKDKEVGKSRKPIRQRLFLRVVRNRVANELEKHGYTKDAAQAQADSIDDDTIMDAVAEQGVSAPADGTFLDWLKENGPALLKIVQTILTLLLAFSSEKPK